MKKQLYIFFLLFTVSFVGFGQVEFEAKLSKNNLGVNERLRIDFEMNKNGDNFTPPEFKDFKVVGGPSQSLSQSWINGKRSFSKTYTFYLQPKRRGSLTIGQAEVEIDGKTYKTSPKHVEATSAVDKPKNGKGEEMVDVSDEIHIVAEVSNTNPYFNQGITVVYKLYVSKNVSVSDWRVVDSPDFKNFWKHDMNPKQFKVKYGSYKGDEDYRYVVLRRAVLYPQKSGKLKIKPLTLDFSVEVPTNKRNFFGRQMTKSTEKTLASNSRMIDVKPLPEKGKPNDFNGAVGAFDFTVTASENNVEAGESLDAQVKVSGKGNLKLFDLPQLVVPNAFEAYEPEHTENATTDLSGMHGSITDTYTLVANESGEYKLNPLSFSYFDPNTKTYKTLNSKEIPIQVTGSKSSTVRTNGGAADSALTHKQPVLSSGRHLHYIKLKTDLHALEQQAFFRSTFFWILLFLPVVLLPLIIGAGRKYKAKTNDLYGNRIRRADRLARKYLSEAKKTLGDQKAYYEALERAFHNYLKAKLDIQTAEMSKERILELLQEKQVSEETSRSFINLLESCDFARYTPPSDVEMQQDYDKAAAIISKVDKELRA